MYWKFLILSLFCIFSIYGQDIHQAATTQNDTDKTTSDITTSKPETTSETEPDTTTTSVSTETTTKSVPVTTSTPMPTASPTGTPSVNEHTYNVSDVNKTCIRLKAGIQFELKDLNITYNMNPNETVVAKDSTCDGPDDTQIMILEDDKHKLTITFANDKKTVYVRNISLSVPEESGVTFDSSDHSFSVNVDNSYYCKAKSEVKLSNNASVLFYELQLQAFMKADEKDFSNAEECDADNKMDDIVPIIVACALVVMIVIILIGYLITRRQSRQRGYQSV